MNKNAKIFIMILIVLVFSLSGYIVYDKFYDNNVKNELNNNIESNDKQKKLEENSQKSEIQDSYELYLEKLSSNITSKHIILNSYDYNEEIELFLNNDGYLYMNDADGEKVKIISNKIVDLFFVDSFSQSDNDFLFILDNKGEVYFVASSYYWTENFDNFIPIKINELQKIISLNTYQSCSNVGCYYTGEFIDIEGNKYNIENIFKKYNIQSE